MPSTRKRIGYLPSINIQQIITKIAENEKLSQSKVVGILVEEALNARGINNIKNITNLIRINNYSNGSHIDSSSFKYNDLDELISDKGITYNKKHCGLHPNSNSSEPIEEYNEELFEQFKQFILFKKMLKEK